MKSEIYILEDDQEYELIDRIEKKDYNYLLLIQADNYKHICIRKEIGDILETLENDEYTNVLGEFIRKNQDLF